MTMVVVVGTFKPNTESKTTRGKEAQLSNLEANALYKVIE
jgi:hypothetical protein